jgi:hypothetical protein
LKEPDITFDGFPTGIFDFFAALEKNNNKKFFDSVREKYENNVVLPSKSFVVNIAPFFEQLNPAIRTEPKFNKTLMRINKDMRFAKGEPYRTFFLIHFGKFKMDSEFYVYITKDQIEYGLFLNNSPGEGLFFKQNLARYQNEIIAVFDKYGLNNKFSLIEMKTDLNEVFPRFNAGKNFDSLKKIKYILIEKGIKKDHKLAASPKFIIEAIKVFSRLYPLYCFAISPEPLKLIERFDEEMGIAE